MPSQRSVMIDISDFGLDPAIPYDTVSGSGRIKKRDVTQNIAKEMVMVEEVEEISPLNGHVDVQPVSEVVLCKEENVQLADVVIEQVKADVPAKEINALRELPTSAPLTQAEQPTTAALPQAPKKSRKKDKNTTQVT